MDAAMRIVVVMMRTGGREEKTWTKIFVIQTAKRGTSLSKHGVYPHILLSLMNKYPPPPPPPFEGSCNAVPHIRERNTVATLML
jgi:hypothetical protein